MVIWETYYSWGDAQEKSESFKQSYAGSWQRENEDGTTRKKDYCGYKETC